MSIYDEIQRDRTIQLQKTVKALQEEVSTLQAQNPDKIRGTFRELGFKDRVFSGIYTITGFLILAYWVVLSTDDAWFVLGLIVSIVGILWFHMVGAAEDRLEHTYSLLEDESNA